MARRIKSISARARKVHSVRRIRHANEQLVIASVRQHELTETAEKLNDQLRAEMVQRQRAVETLRESEQHLRALFELGPVAVYSCDVSGTIQQFNRRAAELWGCEPAPGDTDQRFCGSHKLFRPDGSFMPHEQCPMAEVIAGKIPEARDAEVIIERPDGSRLTVIVNIRPLKNERGQITGAINCFYDITERKHTEDSLRQAQAQLADRAGQLELAVTERTAELSASNSQLEAFIYSVAHDLRAPLRAMQGFSSLLVKEAGQALSKTGQNYAQRIDKSAHFMDDMLIDMLAISRIGQQRLTLVPVSLETVITAILARLELDIQEKNARVEAPGPWPMVLANQPVLDQILFNLVGNALKFVPPGGAPQILLRAESIPNPQPPVRRNADEGGSTINHQLVRVWVEDKGIGIAAPHQDQIFRLFNRLHGDKYEGTGIGLAIVRKGIERMGGNVGVQSTPGQGSRFWFDLKRPTEPQ